MSRLSKAHLKARESIFAAGPGLCRSETLALCPPDLQECVAAMEDCCEEVWPMVDAAYHVYRTDIPGARGTAAPQEWHPRFSSNDQGSGKREG